MQKESGPSSSTLSNEAQFAIIGLNIENIKKSIDKIDSGMAKMSDNQVNHAEFMELKTIVARNEVVIDNHLRDYSVCKSDVTNLKRLVYGFVGLTLMAVVGGLLALVIIRP